MLITSDHYQRLFFFKKKKSKLVDRERSGKLEHKKEKTKGLSCLKSLKTQSGKQHMKKKGLAMWWTILCCNLQKKLPASNMV